jgi:hypothetical protein
MSIAGFLLGGVPNCANPVIEAKVMIAKRRSINNRNLDFLVGLFIALPFGQSF